MIAIVYKLKHFLRGRRVRCAIASMGGVGSTALARHVGSLADKTPREHAYSPVLYAEEKPLKLGYIYGDPYNSVISVFRRDYQNMHTTAMNHGSPTAPGNLKNMSLREYLERGVDEFHLERQLDNWTRPVGSPHPILLIKYEEMAQNMDAILRYFEQDEGFEFKPRKSSWEQQPADMVNLLERMYGDVKAKVDKLPGLQLLQPSAE